MRSSIILLKIVALLLILVPGKADAQLTKQQAAEQKEAALKSWIGKPFPAFSFPGSMGRMYTNKDFEGKVTLVDVWELRCQPCMYSIKYFNAIHDSLQRRGFQLFSMIMNDWGECNSFIANSRNPVSKDYSFPNYDVMSMGSAKPTAANKSASERLNSMGWPYFFVVDGSGIIRAVHAGFAVGNDVHAERPAKEPYANRSIQWMMGAMSRVQNADRDPAASELLRR